MWWGAEVEYDFGNTIASLSQSQNWLENRRSKNNKMLRRVWKVAETEVGKIRVVKTKWGRKEETRKKETRREGAKERRKKEKEEKTKERENNRSKEDSRRIGDLG